MRDWIISHAEEVLERIYAVLDLPGNFYEPLFSAIEENRTILDYAARISEHAVCRVLRACVEETADDAIVELGLDSDASVERMGKVADSLIVANFISVIEALENHLKVKEALDAAAG